MNAHHWIAFFQAVGIIGAMHVNPRRFTSQEDVLNFWLNYKTYETWMKGTTPRMPQSIDSNARYNPAMHGSDIQNPYGAVHFTTESQIRYLRFSDHRDLSEALANGLITVAESARLSHDAELQAYLNAQQLRPEFSRHLELREAQ